MSELIVISLIIGVFIILYLVLRKKQPKKTKAKLAATPQKWKTILQEKVNFYRNLNDLQKLQFETDVQRFLSSIRITGV
jgi:hypothetical protein